MPEPKTPLNVLVVGGGMYVCGRGTEGFGTVLPALFEGYHQGLVARVHVAAASATTAREVAERAERLNGLFQGGPLVETFPREGDDPEAYLAAWDALPPPRCCVVSVPDHLHFPVTMRIMERGGHVLVVKPLTAKADEARTLAAEAAARGLYGAVEYHKRFDEANLKLRELIRSNALGELLHVRVQYSQRRSIPLETFASWVEHTNIFQYLGVHYVDLIHFLTGAKPERVMAVGQKKLLAALGIDTWDCTQTLIEWRMLRGGTFLSSHFTSWVDPETSSAMSDQRLEVVGTEGRYRSDQKDRGVFLSLQGRSPEHLNPYFTQLYPEVNGKRLAAAGYGPRTILQFLRDVADISEKKARPKELAGLRATFASSVVVAQVLEAHQESLARDGAWVAVE